MAILATFTATHPKTPYYPIKISEVSNSLHELINRVAYRFDELLRNDRSNWTIEVTHYQPDYIPMPVEMVEGMQQVIEWYESLQSSDWLFAYTANEPETRGYTNREYVWMDRANIDLHIERFNKGEFAQFGQVSIDHYDHRVFIAPNGDAVTLYRVGGGWCINKGSK